MKQVYEAFALSILASQIPTASAFWRLACGISQTARIDPILNPGSIAGHMHKFAGGINVNSNSDYNSLQTSSCSSCEVQEDKSAYWTPDLYYQHADGTFVEVPNNGMTVYYLGRVNGGSGNTTTPFPEGFKMIAGNSRLRAYDSTTLTYENVRPIADAVSYRCINAANNIPETHGIEQTDCVNGLRAQINFPTCWNGQDLYLPDSAHVAYLSGIDIGDCPPTHPVPLPHLFYEVLYSVNNIDQSDGGRFVFSNGDPTGYGFHGDFMNGWNPDVLQRAVNDCLYPDLNGVASNCPALNESDTSNFPRICPEQPSVVDERRNGTVEDPLTALPGCNPVTPGPAPAPQVVCAVNSSTPITTSSVSSVTATTVSSAISSQTLTTSTAQSLSVNTTTTSPTAFSSSTATSTSDSNFSTSSTASEIASTSDSSTASGSTISADSSSSTSESTSSSSSASSTTSAITTTSISTSTTTTTTATSSSSDSSTINITTSTTSSTSSSTLSTDSSTASSSTSSSDLASSTISNTLTGPASTTATTTSDSIVSTTISTTTGLSPSTTPTASPTITTTTTNSGTTIILPPMTTSMSTNTAITTTASTTDSTLNVTWTWVVAGRTFYFTWGGSFAKRSEPTAPPASAHCGGETTTTLRIKGREFVHVF